jgi:hypothetical protein
MVEGQRVCPASFLETNMTAYPREKYEAFNLNGHKGYSPWRIDRVLAPLLARTLPKHTVPYSERPSEFKRRVEYFRWLGCSQLKSRWYAFFGPPDVWPEREPEAPPRIESTEDYR